MKEREQAQVISTAAFAMPFRLFSKDQAPWTAVSAWGSEASHVERFCRLGPVGLLPAFGKVQVQVQPQLRAAQVLWDEALK